MPHFIAIPHQKEVRSWLFLALMALAMAGVYSILLVVQRTPGFQEIFPGRDFFHTALTVHVNLSVLVWMLSIAGAFGATLLRKHLSMLSLYFSRLAMGGAFSMATSPFVGEGEPFLNNYVPIFYNPLFIFGLCLFLTAVLGQILVVCMTAKLGKSLEGVTLTVGIYTALCMLLLSLVYFLISYYRLRFEDLGSMSQQDYYNTLFWGGGHILQVAYAQLMCIAWFWILESISPSSKMRHYAIQWLFVLNLVIALLSIPFYILFPVSSGDFQFSFTEHMRYANSFLPVLLLLLSLKPLWYSVQNSSVSTVMRTNMWYSLILFFYGGFLALLISGANVTIPAHYHGSIIGISMMLIAWVYLVFPQLGFSDLQGRMVRWQPHCLGLGQILHITGLALSGGYGALRKDPSIITNVKVKFYMGLMGTGGLMAIIGGLLFVVPCLLTIIQSTRTKIRS